MNQKKEKKIIYNNYYYNVIFSLLFHYLFAIVLYVGPKGRSLIINELVPKGLHPNLPSFLTFSKNDNDRSSNCVTRTSQSHAIV